VKQFKFELNQDVLIDGVKCKIRDREIFEGEPDYLVYSSEGFKGITSRGNELPGWLRTSEIKEAGE
jgi:hypothetical protein